MSNLNVFSKSKQIKILVCVLSAGIATGLLFVFALLHYYNPEGVYFANNVLLSPKTFSILQNDHKLKKNLKNLSLDRFEFEYQEGVKQKVITLDQQLYFSFYDLVKNDVSIKETDANIKLATLTVVANDEKKDQEIKISEVDFLQGDYYRILLMDPVQKQTWAYFYHPGIYKTVINLFSGRHEK